MVDDRGALELMQHFARTLVGNYDLDEALGRLAGRLQDVLNVEGAGVMLADSHGVLRLTSSSDPLLEQLEDLQIALDEGPCLRAYRVGKPIMATDLRSDRQFPRFGPRAVDVGLFAVYSYPLQYEGRTFGALNLYRSQPGPLGEHREELGETFADIAALYLMHGADDERRELINRQLQGALDSRVLIEQAKGFVAAAADTSTTVAFEALRAYARRHGAPLRAVALDVVERRLSVDDVFNGAGG